MCGVFLILQRPPRHQPLQVVLLAIWMVLRLCVIRDRGNRLEIVEKSHINHLYIAQLKYQSYSSRADEYFGIGLLSAFVR